MAVPVNLQGRGVLFDLDGTLATPLRTWALR